MKKLLLALALSLTFSLFSESIIKKRITNAPVGSYIVFEQGKTATLLSIQEINDSILVLEEISCPTSLTSKISNWQNWINDRAPGHTSWVMYKIDLQKAKMLECFSFSRSSWIPIEGQEHFLTLLLKTSLTKVVERKKIGLPPMPGEMDLRPIWNPPFFYEGKKKSLSFEAYEMEWPKDDTELSQKLITAYFDNSNLSPFPVWVQISNDHIAVFAREIDAGTGLVSYYSGIPQKVLK
ncbi:MAG TPA: hypothetical protein VLG44_05020 [Chlamydiales bacterium]|nr:hypothetical protein [Chlamydiales bacterium]